MNAKQPAQNNSLPSSLARGVYFIVIGDSEEILFSSPSCTEDYGLAANEKIKWIQKDEKYHIKLTNRSRKVAVVEEVLVRAVFDLPWHGRKAKMLLLDETPYRDRILKDLTAGKSHPAAVDSLPWISFRCKFDESLEMIDIDDQAMDLTGYSAQELLASSPKAFRKLIPVKKRQEIWKLIQEMAAQDKPYQVMYPFHSAGSDIRWFQENGRVKKGKDGIAYVKGWVIDMTERKRTAEALWESEARYRSLVEASPDAVLMVDKNSQILLVNQHFCDMLGVPNAEAILGKNMFQFFSPQVPGESFSTIEEAISKLPPTGNSLLLNIRSGDSIPLEVNLSTIRNAAGEVYAYVAVGRDVRRRFETQKALRESEARYRAIVEDNLEMVVRFNKDGEVTFANAAFCNYTGLKPAELIGQKIEGKVTGQGHHLVQKLLSQFRPDMPPMENEFSLRDSKRGETWFRWKTIAIKDNNNQFIEYQSIGEDITTQKKSRLAELDAQNRLREVLESIKLIAIILDSSGRVIFCNSHFLEITGWRIEEVLQSDWVSNFVPQEDAARLKSALFDGALKGSVPVRNENPIVTRSGERRMIAWYNTLLRNSRGEYEGIASIGEDITEKAFSEKIREVVLKISQSTNQTDDLDSLYQSIQDALKDLMPVDNFFIALYDEEKDILSFPFYQDIYDPQPEPDKPKRGLTDYVLRTGEAMLVNPQRFEELVASGEVDSIGTPSLDWIGVPLKVENKTIGVMGAQTYSPGVRYEAKEEQILTFVSNQIAMAIDRKRSDQALRDSQKRNELLVAASSDAIFAETLEGDFLDFNDIATQMYGYTREELFKLKVHDLIPKEMAANHPNYIQWELDQGGDLHDILNVRKDGSVFPVDVSVRQAITEQGPVLISYVRDITEQKMAAQVIIESEEKFRALAENSAAGIFIHSGGKNIYVNPMWSMLTEYPVLELLQKKPIDLVDPSIHRHEKEKLAARLRGEKVPDRFEFNIVTRSGEKRVIDLNITSIKFEDKNAIMGTAIDITTRRQREHELEVIAQMSEALRISILRTDVLETSISKVSEILKIDGAYIAMVDEQTEEIIMHKAMGIWMPIEGTVLQRGEGLGGHIISTGEIYVNQQPQTDPYVVRPDLVSSMASIAGVPLITNGRTIGTLVVGSKHRLLENEISLLKAIGDFTASALHRAELFEHSSLQARELKQAYNSTLEGWALALELRDKETQGHSVRIANLTLKLARRMGIPESEMEKIRRGALLHDIGKLGVPDTVLLKHSTLTPDEWAIMQKHPDYAHEMLSQLKDFKDSIDIPYCHHEWWDGSGYPRGLEGEEIPLPARIFCIVDVWDALTSDRPYRDAWNKEEALAHIINQAGTHFDPHVVNEFIQMIVESK